MKTASRDKVKCFILFEKRAHMIKYRGTEKLLIDRGSMKKNEIHILIIDDNDNDVSLCSNYLEKGDINIAISHVRRAEEAVDKLNTHKYDICLVDVHLPGMGGIDFIRHILDHGDNLPTIVLTDKGDEKTAVNALKLGAYDYLLKKELNQVLLNKTINRAINEHRVRKEKERLQEELEAYSKELEKMVTERTRQVEYLSSYKELILANLDLYVRVVDPFSHIVQYESGKIIADFGANKGETCYSFWKKNKECENCTGKTSLESHKVAIKEEAAGNKIYSITSIPLKNMDDSMSVIEVIRDITDHKRVGAELNQKNRLAAMGEMSSHLGHEIRNPLHRLGLSYELLRESPEVKGTEREIVESIGESLEVLFTMANDLLDYSRKDTLCREEADIPKLVTMVTSELSQKLENSCINLSLDIPPKQINLSIDKLKIHQAIINIINNGIQAMPKGGELGIDIKEKDKLLKIVITDSGCGISRENIEKIFVPFFTTKTEGTGLGMPIVKHFIELHGGDLSVESIEGTGTTVTITLPI